MNIKALNEAFSIADLLANEGIHPVKKHGAEWAYISPIREPESAASFMVNIVKNRWHDHGLGVGGKLFDLAVRLYPTLGMSQVIQLLAGIFSFRQQSPAIPNRETPRQNPQQVDADGERKVKIFSEGRILSLPLIRYLAQRCIPLELAAAHCKEVWYELYGKKYYALGFKNSAGGYELRNPYFKGSSSPKAVTFIDNNSNQVAVFEGFFSFLSYLSLYGNSTPQTNYLVLNSLSFFNRSLPLMERHTTINLYLDRDAAGMKYTEQALRISPRFKDDSFLYESYKDLNQFLVSNPPQKKGETPAGNFYREVSERKISPGRLLPHLGKGRGI